MCGIAGYLSTEDLGVDVLHGMLAAIHHRGPDEDSFWHDRNFHVGMCRLAINDLAHGSQPLYNGDQSVVVMYNGEIYNSPELRRQLVAKGYEFRTGSDGEVIAHMYDEHGTDLFGYLDGMFAIALWDKSSRTLLLARDQVGEKPLYYSGIEGGFGVIFASEIKAFRQIQGLDVSLNRQAVWDFPTFLWIPEPETIYCEIRALPRSHILSLNDNGTVLHKYQSKLTPAQLAPLEDCEAVDETRRVVDQAVHSRLLSDVPVGSFLSGGLDSSIVATIATRELGRIDTFSVAFDQLEDPYHGASDESELSAAYAQTLGSRHHTIHVTADSLRDALDEFVLFGDQPFAVSSGLGVLAVAEMANDVGVKVLLSGDCADECFGGYSWYRHLILPSGNQGDTFDSEIVSYQNFGLSLRERLSQMAGYSAQQRAWAWHYYAHEEEKKALFAPEWREGLASSLRYFTEFASSPEWEPLQFVAQDRNFYLPNEMLRKVDRMTMAYSVEGRVPFAAPTVLAHADRLNYTQMVRGSSLKWALRQAYRDILPVEVVDRPKHGFNVPVDQWLREEWRDLLTETFAPSSALNQHGMLSSNAGQVAETMLYDKERLNGHTLLSFVALNRWLES